ncbi:Uncharacterized protein APZ42_021257 [Daphnia magna]|uniref:RRM domain-containing protein n=1 Tax=Daphnia magna TaxID=35525 RepID=A0A164WU07_9CRUS|nr:Uncharacterized protein APZ42_021257 [Daphnia magna]
MKINQVFLGLLPIYIYSKMADQISIFSREFYEVKQTVESLWVYNLSYATTTQEIVDYFEQLVGPIEFFAMYLDKGADFLCKAEIIFHRAEDARRALLLYDGTQFDGRQMVLKLLVDGRQIHPEQIVFPGSVNRLPVVLEERLLPDDITRDFPNDTNFDQSSCEGTDMFLPEEDKVEVESFEKSQDDPNLEKAYPPSDSSRVNDDYYCLLVSNLQYSVKGEQLLEFFEKMAGPVKSVGMYLNDKSFLCGKAVIVFRHPRDAQKALVCCNGTVLKGRRIYLKLYVNGQRLRANQIVLPESSSAEDWIYPHVPFVSLPSPNCMTEYFPDEPILGPFTMPTTKEGIDQRPIHPQGPGYPPFLPLVFVKDCVRPYVAPVFE